MWEQKGDFRTEIAMFISGLCRSRGISFQNLTKDRHTKIKTILFYQNWERFEHVVSIFSVQCTTKNRSIELKNFLNENNLSFLECKYNPLEIYFRWVTNFYKNERGSEHVIGSDDKNKSENVVLSPYDYLQKLEIFDQKIIDLRTSLIEAFNIAGFKSKIEPEIKPEIKPEIEALLLLANPIKTLTLSRQPQSAPPESSYLSSSKKRRIREKKLKAH